MLSEFHNVELKTEICFLCDDYEHICINECGHEEDDGMVMMIVERMVMGDHDGDDDDDIGHDADGDRFW